VADFYCPNCAEEYELKSKHTSISSKVPDGAYDTMIERINSINNPNFFFMQYDKVELRVKNLVMVPKHFFVPEIIEKRNPLGPNARRVGWVGCNIVLKQVPDEGRVYIVKDEIEQPIENVIAKVEKTNFIKEYNSSTGVLTVSLTTNFSYANCNSAWKVGKSNSINSSIKLNAYMVL